ncbi:MAG: D-TA family PLP-dependent enzyme [Anaerolineae bacterium]|nr:D-TA family PLP-dependent enzyme [Anaerolineae bacterium]
MRIEELDTPALVVDLDKLEANIAKLQAYLASHGIANRPHIKTHKIPEIAHMQIRAGAIGITCQKLGEAEVMADAGIRDIFIPYNLVGEQKLTRLAKLMRRVTVSVAADSEATARGLSEAARMANRELTVLVEFDAGAHRCGVQSPREAADLAKCIAGLPGLVFGGLMCYPNTPQLDPFVRETRALLEAEGLGLARVSGGGTACMWQAHTHRELTEHRAGMYVYGDRATVQSGAMRLEECALTVIATVVSRPTADRGILDCGSKTLSSDLLGLQGHGLILEYPDAVIYGLSEEHGHVDFSACSRKPTVGERVTVLPNHCCPVSNLFDRVVGVRNGEVELTWRVAARGAVQ